MTASDALARSTTALEPPGGPHVAIEVEALTKTYRDERGGSVRALEDVGFRVAPFEFVSILGPSGCGKSTLLRVMAGLTGHDGGRVSLDGSPVTEPSDDVGVVFQTDNLLPWRTIASNLELGVRIREGAPADLEARRSEMVETLGLGGFESRYPHELSGGMRQRVALGQALMRRPRVLFLDEPFGALDALTRDRLNLELLRIWQAERKTVVLVTHSIPEAVLLSDRVLVLSERPGRLALDLRIDLPRPRDPRATRESPDFGRYVVRLSEQMGVI